MTKLNKRGDTRGLHPNCHNRIENHPWRKPFQIGGSASARKAIASGYEYQAAIQE